MLKGHIGPPGCADVSVLIKASVGYFLGNLSSAAPVLINFLMNADDVSLQLVTVYSMVWQGNTVGTSAVRTRDNVCHSREFQIAGGQHYVFDSCCCLSLLPCYCTSSPGWPEDIDTQFFLSVLAFLSMSDVPSPRQHQCLDVAQGFRCNSFLITSMEGVPSRRAERRLISSRKKPQQRTVFAAH